MFLPKYSQLEKNDSRKIVLKISPLITELSSLWNAKIRPHDLPLISSTQQTKSNKIISVYCTNRSDGRVFRVAHRFLGNWQFHTVQNSKINDHHFNPILRVWEKLLTSFDGNLARTTDMLAKLKYPRLLEVDSKKMYAYFAISTNIANFGRKIEIILETRNTKYGKQVLVLAKIQYQIIRNS